MIEDTMNTFVWLLIAHLLGDWLLQNDWMARGKKQGFFTRAGILHCCIYTGAALGGLWLSGVRDRSAAYYLLAGAGVFVSHWLVDAGDVAARWMRWYRQSNLEMVRVMVDQTLHVLVLALVALSSLPM
jgi:hypothetical protein